MIVCKRDHGKSRDQSEYESEDGVMTHESRRCLMCVAGDARLNDNDDEEPHCEAGGRCTSNSPSSLVPLSLSLPSSLVQLAFASLTGTGAGLAAASPPHASIAVSRLCTPVKFAGKHAGRQIVPQTFSRLLPSFLFGQTII